MMIFHSAIFGAPSALGALRALRVAGAAALPMLILAARQQKWNRTAPGTFSAQLMLHTLFGDLKEQFEIPPQKSLYDPVKMGEAPVT